jgi:pyrimidine operon attenuation protein/uracil phosphoribosyltransferase
VNTINNDDLDTIIADMAQRLGDTLKTRGIEHPLMVGIHTGGVWIAERLHRLMGLQEDLGRMDISFYRDDFTRIGLNPVVKPSQLPAVDKRHIVLVDDVLHTGRTIRAALNELFDYGRPASVMLVVLAERSGRELPIVADVAGLRPDLQPTEHIKLTGPDPLALVIGNARSREQKQGA